MPAWFLLPGLGAFLTSLAFYVQYQRDYPASGLDLGIYRQGAQAFSTASRCTTSGSPSACPYTYPPVTLPLLAPLAGLDMPWHCTS